MYFVTLYVEQGSSCTCRTYFFTSAAASINRLAVANSSATVRLA